MTRLYLALFSLLALPSSLIAQSTPSSETIGLPTIPNATIRCGFHNPGNVGMPWQAPALYAIDKFHLSFAQVTSDGPHLVSQKWVGLRAKNGELLLLGQGGGVDDTWLMEFRGTWKDDEIVILIGRYENETGPEGYRDCTIELRPK